MFPLLVPLLLPVTQVAIILYIFLIYIFLTQVNIILGVFICEVISLTNGQQTKKQGFPILCWVLRKSGPFSFLILLWMNAQIDRITKQLLWHKFVSKRKFLIFQRIRTIFFFKKINIISFPSRLH